jgi:hypothetical protein
MALYRPVSLILCIIFAAVGVLFLTIPGGVQEFFNTLSEFFNMPMMTISGFGFYQILAVGYMYVVTVIIFFMYRHPDDLRYPVLLMHGKFATSLLSLGMFVFFGQYLMFLANFIIDALIGATVLYFYINMRRKA